MMVKEFEDDTRSLDSDEQETLRNFDLRVLQKLDKQVVLDSTVVFDHYYSIHGLDG